MSKSKGQSKQPVHIAICLFDILYKFNLMKFKLMIEDI